MKKILIINGPNLNLLGKREPTVYGNDSFEDYLKQLREKYPQCEIAYYQSNVEGELINKIHEVGFSYDGIILKCRSLYAYIYCPARRNQGSYNSGYRGSHFQCSRP